MIKEAAKDLQLPWANLPLLGAWIWEDTESTKAKKFDLGKLLTYTHFQRDIKDIFAVSCPQLQKVSAHSLRHGGTTEKVMSGIHRRLVQHLGRWASEKCFEGYISDIANDTMCAEVLSELEKRRQQQQQEKISPSAAEANTASWSSDELKARFRSPF